jgi:hypothetical protein
MPQPRHFGGIRAKRSAPCDHRCSSPSLHGVLEWIDCATIQRACGTSTARKRRARILDSRDEQGVASDRSRLDGLLQSTLSAPAATEIAPIATAHSRSIAPPIAHTHARMRHTHLAKLIHRYQPFSFASRHTAIELLKLNGHEPRPNCKTYIDGIIPNEDLISTQQNGAK